MEGFVLRRIDYGESDQIIKIFLKEEGQVSGVAKGIKRSKRRFPHHLEPFRVYDFTFQGKPGQELYFIQAADQLRDYEGIPEDLRRIALGNVILEVLLIAVKTGQPHPDLYSFVLQVFSALNTADEIYPLWFYAMIHIMRLLGFSPNFESCLKCRAPLRSEGKPYLDPSGGGLLCNRCAALSKPSNPPARPETIGVLQFLKKTSPQAASRLRISDPTRMEIEGFLTAFLLYHLGRPLKSIPLLKEILE